MRQLPALLLLLCCTLVQASPADKLKEANFAAQWSDNSPALQRKSEALLNYLWVDVYAAAVFTEAAISPAQAFNDKRDLRLELYYFRDIDRNDVIKAATVTIKRQLDPARLAKLQAELDRLHEGFQNIRQGDRYALVYRRPGQLTLERNGQAFFHSDNPDLARAYLGIWLAPNGLSDSLRTALLQP
ncbi:chalcone isomerase family protein [Pseudomonas abieticivorans]|uniref:chalcone isomerase family protein n=1 Tax=Pseudomonas abieticivorans TaxID=2931382 RepID=UPI0020BEC1BF|nr:chalcone isomerase family protein [Pseudomonas sp. PIA16]